MFIGLFTMTIYIAILVVLIVSLIKTNKKNEILLRQEVRSEILNKAKQMIESGEVTYLSVYDVERIVETVRNTRIFSQRRAGSRKTMLVALIFFTVGLIAAILFALLYKDNLVHNSREEQKIIDEECELVLAKLRGLDDSGVVNYFSFDDIVNQTSDILGSQPSDIYERQTSDIYGSQPSEIYERQTSDIFENQTAEEVVNSVN